MALSYPDPMERQPEEWEALLKDVTVERDYHERTCNPLLLYHCEGQMNFGDFMEMRQDEDSRQETDAQVETVRRIVDRKTKGLVRKCMRLLLMTGASRNRIAEILGISPDKAERAVLHGIKTVRDCLQEKQYGSFPVPAGKRPIVRAAVFPLDTPKEQAEFQRFLNHETVMHLSYRGDDLLREVLVVYLKNNRVKNKLHPASRLISK